MILNKSFPTLNLKLRADNYLLIISWLGGGFPYPLGKVKNLMPIPDVETILYDEFIREKDNSGYLPNEVPALLNFMDTVFRDSENVRCIGMANAVTIVNPFFLYFGLIPNIKKRYNAYESIVIEIPNSEDFSAARRRTKFGTLIDGTEYGEMSLR
jgi:hypothetical protein